MITRNRALALALASVCLGTPALAKPKIVEFDAPNAGQIPQQGTTVAGIDDKGDVVGRFVDTSGNEHGFMRKSDGTFVVYGTSDATLTQGVNSRRQVTGTFDNGSRFSGYVSDTTGTLTSFDGPDATDTTGAAINDSGVVAGAYADSSSVFHGLLRSKRGTLTTFDAPGAGTSPQHGTFSNCIGADGTVCGYYSTDDNFRHAFVRDADGTIAVFDVIPGAQRSIPLGINGDDTIVGYYRDPSSIYHGFIRTADGTLTSVDIEGAGTAAGQGTNLEDINNKGVMAGEITDSSNVAHSLIRSAHGKITKFDPPDSGSGVGQGSFPVAINKKNAVAGTYIDNNNVSHGYLRLP